MAPSHRAHLLIVEPHTDTREVLELLLSERGFSVRTERNALEALTALNNAHFDAVLATIRPGDAWDAFERLASAAAPARVGILSTQALDPEAKQRGFPTFIRKPFELSALLATVADLSQAPPVPEEKERVIRGYFSALTEKNWGALGELCTDDVVYHVPGNTRLSRAVRGRSEFAAFSEETFREFPGASFELQSVHALPSGVVARYVGRWGEDGAISEMPGSVLFQFNGLRLCEIGVRLELEKVLAQLPS